MFSNRWQLFRLLGIPISVDASWLIILGLLTLSLATGFPAMLHQYFPGATHELAPAEYWVMGLVTALAFFGCILLHELGHAVVAKARGMPIRGITLFLFGGVAELGDEPTSARTEFLMAVAGPIVSVILACGFWLMAVVGYHAGWPHPVLAFKIDRLLDDPARLAAMRRTSAESRNRGRPSTSWPRWSNCINRERGAQGDQARNEPGCDQSPNPLSASTTGGKS